MDSQLSRVLEKLPVLELHDIDAIRTLNTSTRMPVSGSDSSVPTAERTILGLPGNPEVKIRVYGDTDPARLKPAIAHAHPGLTFGTLEMDHARCLRYAAEIGCVVVSVDYRLAPEHPYPAAVDDCYAALLWAASSRDTTGIDPARIAVAGCSTAATLAAAVALRARDQHGPALAFQMLIQPSLDDRMTTASMAEFHDPGPCEAGRVGSGHTWRYYLASTAAEPPPYAAPTRATDLRDLPATYISTVEYDCLRDEGWDYARRLMGAGVPVEFHHYPGAFHAFDLVVRTAAISKRALAEQCKVLARALSVGPRAAARRRPGVTGARRR
jgi:acetyl esterase/lipase